MMRITGFLAGVGLTIATFMIILNSRDNRQAEISAASTVGHVQAELAAVVEAIAERVDVVKSGDKPDQAVAPDPESGMVDPDLQSGSVEASGASTPGESSDMSTDMVARADVVQVANKPDQSITTDVEAQQDFQGYGPDQDYQPEDQAQATTESADQEDTDTSGTYLFWSPFRSEWAAQGFAERLTLSTQVPVEVFYTGPGNYRVAFSYRNEVDRRVRIEHIETITGLKLE